MELLITEKWIACMHSGKSLGKIDRVNGRWWEKVVLY
jgi:hypothetical protein